jgi:hypothetical protein
MITGEWTAYVAKATAIDRRAPAALRVTTNAG